VLEWLGNNLSELRAHTQEVILHQLEAAGFDVRIVNIEGGVLFGAACLSVSVTMSGCAVDVAPDPSVTTRFGCDEFPREENGFQGPNRTFWCDRAADALMKASDRELDPGRRLELLEQVYQIQARDFIGLPLYAMPGIVAWRSGRLAGPIDRYLSSPYGPFFNIDEWYQAE
jgi:ABC-type transport system substrate-binding protein